MLSLGVRRGGRPGVHDAGAGEGKIPEPLRRGRSGDRNPRISGRSRNLGGHDFALGAQDQVAGEKQGEDGGGPVGRELAPPYAGQAVVEDVGEEMAEAEGEDDLADEADPDGVHGLFQALQGGGADGSGIEPGLADTLLRETVEAAKKQEKLGLLPVLLVSGNLRWLLSRFLRRAWPNLKVLSNSEIPETKTIKVTAVIGIKS